jgi:hypothetical protein
MECRITIFIWLFPVIGSLVGWVNGYFNPSIGGSLCMMIGKPLQCNIDPEIYGDCIRGKKASLASLFLAVLPVVLSFAMLIINLARFSIHVYQQEQMFKPTNQEPRSGGSDGNGRNNGTSSAADVEITIIRDEGRRRGVPSSLAKQSLVQSRLYIASFIICYFGPIITMVMTGLRIPPPAWLVWCVSIFWPLGGFFNILIYTRPKVSSFKESNPEYSRLCTCFLSSSFLEVKFQLKLTLETTEMILLQREKGYYTFLEIALNTVRTGQGMLILCQARE